MWITTSKASRITKITTIFITQNTGKTTGLISNSQCKITTTMTGCNCKYKAVKLTIKRGVYKQVKFKENSAHVRQVYSAKLYLVYMAELTVIKKPLR